VYHEVKKLGCFMILWVVYPPQDNATNICATCPIASKVGYVLEEPVNKQVALHVA